jgi:hypothetical protein
MTETVRYYWWEYAAKGGLVGLLAAIALAPANPIVAVTLYGSIVAGFVVAMTIAGWHALRRSNQRIRGRFWPFLCYLILERPGAVYAGVLVGLLAGLTVCLFLGWLHNWHWLALAGVLGAATGVLFSLFLGLHNRWLRTSTVLISAAVAAARIYYGHHVVSGMASHSVPGLVCHAFVSRRFTGTHTKRG